MIDKNKPYFITSKNFHGDKEYFYKGVTGDCERTSCSGSLQLSKSAMNALYFYKKVNVSSMKSEQGWLRVNRSQDIDTRFLWEAAVCSDCTQEIDNKIIEAPMP